MDLPIGGASAVEGLQSTGLPRLVFLFCQFLLVFSILRREGNTIVMYIKSLFFQDRYSEIVNYAYTDFLKVIFCADKFS